MNSLERFIDAQKDSYEDALFEIKQGRKRTHWMWYIFPQIKGLGKTSTSIYYSINSLEEAKDYLNHEVLGARLIEISKELLKLEINDPVSIFGSIDSLKLKSCMTLFFYVSKEAIFYEVLEKFYDGTKDELTIDICKSLESDKRQL